MQDVGQKKISSLDGLRGIAAVVVSLVHMQFSVSILTDNFLVKGADWPVDLFFVVSGFVICYAYGDKISNFKGIKNFIYRRFWRLYPLHFITLILLVFFEFARYFLERTIPGTIINPAFSKADFAAFFSNLFLIQVLNGKIHSFNGPSWSISAELIAYLVFVLVAISNYSKLKLFSICSMLSFFAIYFFEYTNLPGNFLLVLRCIYGFSLGAMAFYFLKNYSGKRFYGEIFVNISIFLSILMIYLDLHLINKNLLPISFACLVYGLVISDQSTLASKVLSNKFFQHVGKVSYSIYMWHVILWILIGNILRFGLGNNGIIFEGARYMYWGTGASIFITILSVALLIGLSTISFYLIENRFREIFKPNSK